MAGNWHRIGDIKGRDGIGVPTGGARGDVLKKEGGTDYATSWGAVDYADIQGKVPASALPEIGTAPYVVDSQAAMLNLPAVPGRQAIRTDIGATFVLAQEPASTLENWIEMVSRSDVTSVNSKTGSVVLTKADVGLSEVNNTSDSDKPVATQSVRGLMSSDDKTKLDGATHSATGNAIARRDSQGRVSFRSVAVSDQPSQSAHAVPLGFLETALAGKYGTGKFLSNTEDLNDLKSDEVYTQHLNASASLDRNYPEANAGALWVKSNSSASMVYQIYITYQPTSSRVYYRTYYVTWGPWKELATTALATSSRDGLMPRADKTLLDGATRSNTSNSLVKRGSGSIPTHIGRAETDNITYIGQNASGPQAVANKQYVDWEINRLVAGGTIGFEDSWNTLGSLSRAGIVEGWPLGCPAGAKSGIADFQASEDFVKDPVWRFHHEVMGLGYHRQTAELLSCNPDYMIGFTWERTYHPGTSTWQGWTCIAGDTGPIESMPSTDSSWKTNLDVPFVHKPNNMYRSNETAIVSRTANIVHITGTFTVASQEEADDINTASGGRAVSFGWFTTAGNALGRGVWIPTRGAEDGRIPVGVQTGSSYATWTAYVNTNTTETINADVMGLRYGPLTPSSNVFLPLKASWPAPQVHTWQGSGWNAG